MISHLSSQFYYLDQATAMVFAHPPPNFPKKKDLGGPASEEVAICMTTFFYKILKYAKISIEILYSALVAPILKHFLIKLVQ